MCSGAHPRLPFAPYFLGRGPHFEAQGLSPLFPCFPQENPLFNAEWEQMAIWVFCGLPFALIQWQRVGFYGENIR